MPQGRASNKARLSGWDVVASVFNSHRLGLPALSKAGTREVAWAIDVWEPGAGAPSPDGDVRRRTPASLPGTGAGWPSKLLLLDEPLISLDPHYQREVVQLVRSLQRELGITVLLVRMSSIRCSGCWIASFSLGAGHAALGTVDDVAIAGPVLWRLPG